jgi:hypothetical protein
MKTIDQGIFRGMRDGSNMHRNAKAVVAHLARASQLTKTERQQLAILEDMKTRIYVVQA